MIHQSLFCSLERICHSELIDPVELIELIKPIEPIMLIELTWILYSEKSTGQVCGKNRYHGNEKVVFKLKSLIVWLEFYCVGSLCHHAYCYSGLC